MKANRFSNIRRLTTSEIVLLRKLHKTIQNASHWLHISHLPNLCHQKLIKYRSSYNKVFLWKMLSFYFSAPFLVQSFDIFHLHQTMDSEIFPVQHIFFCLFRNNSDLKKLNFHYLDILHPMGYEFKKCIVILALNLLISQSFLRRFTHIRTNFTEKCWMLKKFRNTESVCLKWEEEMPHIQKYMGNTIHELRMLMLRIISLPRFRPTPHPQI